jgi:hypothetical protein
MNDRVKYESLEMEIIAFNANNVITTGNPSAKGWFVPN